MKESVSISVGTDFFAVSYTHLDVYKRQAKKCMHIVYENIYFAIGIKVLCLILGAAGIANMWLAIFADVGVMVLAVLNAVRALFVKKL